jgi:hypothetical protein
LEEDDGEGRTFGEEDLVAQTSDDFPGEGESDGVEGGLGASMAAARSCEEESEIEEERSERSLHRNLSAWPNPAHVHPACVTGPPFCTRFENSVDAASFVVTVDDGVRQGMKSAMTGGGTRRRGIGSRHTPARSFLCMAKP